MAFRDDEYADLAVGDIVPCKACGRQYQAVEGQTLTMDAARCICTNVVMKWPQPIKLLPVKTGQE